MTEAERGEAQEHRWVRPFRWGLLMAYDQGAPWNLPQLGGAVVTSSDTCLAVPVLHAQDIEIPPDAAADDVLPEAQVSVHVMVGATEDRAAEFVGTLTCPSGQLSFGDADEERVIIVPPGQLRVAVFREPAAHAERVTIFVSGTSLSPA